MTLRVMWAGIAAYFFLFWFAVGDLGVALVCTFFLIVIGLQITKAAIRAVAPSSDRQFRTEAQREAEGAANRNAPPS